MTATILNVVLLVTLLSFGAAASTSTNPYSERQLKQLSLFSVVTFQNSACTSESSLTGGSRQGTCFTATECADKSGTKSGNCAAGFGVCCIFIENSGATATITQNRTHIRNSEYPSYTTATAATTIAYTLQKLHSDICQIRLDFTAFVIAGPANSNENIPGATTVTHCNDILTLVQTGGAALPPLCGALTGEHIYIDLGHDSTDTSVMTITTVATGTITPALAQRLWDVQTSQIECYATYRAPEGCHRYFTSMYGKIISMNFLYITAAGANLQNSGVELSGQDLNTCIRRSKGMCCVQYLVCTSYNSIALVTDTTGVSAAANTGNKAIWSQAWTIDLDSTPLIIDAIEANSGMVDASCTSDYVEIPSSSGTACGAAHASSSPTQNSRYCGARFGPNLPQALPATTHSNVCDCSEPFMVTHHSDISSDEGGSANVAIINNVTNIVPRGFCLDFSQTPCYY